MSGYAANSLSRAANEIEQTTGSGAEQALVAAGDFFTGLANLTPVGIAQNVFEGFQASQAADENRSFIDNFVNGGIIAGGRAYDFAEPVLSQYDWDAVTGTYDYLTDLPAYYATNAAVLWQGAADFANGTFDAEEFATNQELASDIFSDTYEDGGIDVGQAILSNFAAAGQIATAPIQRIAAAISGKPLDAVQAEQGRIAREWSLGFMSPDFNLFSAEDRQVFDEGLSRIGSGTFSAASQVAFDPINVIPFGAVGKVLKGARLLNKSSKLSEDSRVLVREVEGNGNVTTKYSRDLDFFARNNAGTIMQHSIIRSIPSSQRSQVAYLLGEVNTRADAARVLLAVEKGSLRAQVELANKYSHLTLSLDGLNAGGYVNRQALKGEATLGVIDNSQFLDAVGSHLDSVESDPFIKTLTNLAYREVGGEIVDTPQMMRTLGSAGRVMGSVERMSAVARARLIQDGQDGFFFMTRQGDGNPLVQFMIRRVAWGARGLTINGRGFVDVDDTTGIAFDRFAGNLADIDYLTKNELTRSGIKQGLLDQFRLATTPAERKRIIDEAEAVGFRLMAEKQGMNRARAMDTWKGFKAAQVKYFQARRERGYAVLSDGSVVRDPMLKEATEGTVELMNWKLVNQALREDAGGVKGVALRGLGKSGRAAYTALSAINNFHIAAVLFRPARIPRERLQGSLGVIGSGYWKEMWLDPDALRAPARIFVNTLQRGNRVVDRVLTKFGALDDPRLLSELAGETTGALRETDRAIDALRQRTMSLLNRRDLDPDDRQILEDILDELDGELLFHGSPDGLPTQLDESRWLATTEVASDADAYIDNILPRQSLSGAAGRNVEAAELKQSGEVNRWQKAIDSVSDKNAARQADIDDKQAQIAELSTTLSKRQVGLQEASTRVAEAEQALATADAALAAARKANAPGRRELIAQRAQAQRGLTAARRTETAASREVTSTETEIRRAQNSISARQTAQQADEAKALAQINTGLGQSFSSLDEARDFIRSSSDAVISFRSSLLDEIDAGNTVQRRFNGQWITETRTDLQNRTPIFLSKQEYRVIPAGKAPKLERVRVYGARAEMDDFDNLPNGLAEHMGWRNQSDVNSFFADDSWRSDVDFMSWIRSNRIGKVAVPDSSVSSGKTVHVLPEMTDYNGNAPLLQRLDTQSAEAVIQPTNRSAIANSAASAKETATEVSETRKRILKTEDSTYLRQEVQRLVDQRSRLRNEQAAYSSRAAAAKARREGKQKPTRRRGQGQMVIRGQVFDEVFAGPEGEKWARLSSAKETFDNLIQGANNAHASLDDIVETTILDPSDPQYFDGLADLMNTHYRLADGSPDPIVKMIAEGADDKAIRNWLLNTREGKNYRDSVGVGKEYVSLDPKVDGWNPRKPYSSQSAMGLEHMSIDEYVETLRYSVNAHLPTSDLKRRFLDGETFTASGLQSELGPYADMLERIDGRISIPAERKGATMMLRQGARQVQRVMNEIPQTVMENHPMMNAAYNDILAERLDDAERILGRKLTLAEGEDLMRQAREAALNEVRKWTYTISKTTNLTETLRLGIPFITAYTFTIRTIARALRDNPAESLWFAYNADRAIGKLPWVDSEGEPTHFLNAEAAVLRLSPEVASVLRKIPVVGDAMAEGSEIRLSARSMDVFFGGELAPGAGALISVPLGEYIRRNPEKANNAFVDWALPFGAGTSALDVASPKSLANQYHKWRGEDSSLYAQKLVQVAVHEDAKYRLGLRDTKPTADELRAKANALFDLSSGINLFSPISFSVTQPAQEARRVYDQYVEYYGKEEADWRFLSEQPELAMMFASATVNEYRLDPTQEAVSNLRKYTDIVEVAAQSGDAGKDMLGFLMNGSGTEDFDAAAYNYLKQNSPGLGNETFIELLSPEKAIERAAVRNGWIQWRQITNFLDAEAVKRGTTVEADPELAAAKKHAGFLLGQENPEWNRARRMFDGNKFNDQAEILEAAFTDPEWMRDNGDRPEIRAIAQFLEVRTFIRNTVIERGRNQMLSSLADNPDLKAAYLFAVQQLKEESPMFAEFYNQYFDEDTVM